MLCFNCQHPNRSNAHFCAQCGAPLQLQDKYRIVGLLGRGGFSAVYEAEHLGLGGARFAIKELFPDAGATPAQRQTASNQFRFEASTLAKLRFPALPQVMDFFSERGRDYLVMEFVPGDTLQEYLAKTNVPLPEAQVLQWIAAQTQSRNFGCNRSDCVKGDGRKSVRTLSERGGHAEHN